MTARLILFTRYPQPGSTKTRLIPKLGKNGAARLQRQLTERTLATCRAVSSLAGCEIEVAYCGGSDEAMRAWLGPVSCVPQEGGDLGERLQHCFCRAFAEGCGRALVIGSDIPGLCPHHLRMALDGLRVTDVMIGPAPDGGYWGIGLSAGLGGGGLSASMSNLFKGIEWGTERVFGETMARVRAAGLSKGLLPELADLDRPGDLAGSEWTAVSPGTFTDHQTQERIAVIIPARNEEGCIARSVGRAASAPGVEVIVVDGGSTDNTVKEACSSGATVVFSPPGRAGQMNLGADLSTATILVFVHADTLLPDGYAEKVRAAMAARPESVGAFRLAFDRARLPLRVIGGLANVRSKWFSLPYGDQALFLRQKRFQELGGYRDTSCLEDLDLVCRARSRHQVCLLPEEVITSSRRWRASGLLRTTLGHQILLTGYFLGFRPELLAWLRRICSG